MNHALTQQIVEIASKYLPQENIFHDGRSVYLKDNDSENAECFDSDGLYIGYTGLAVKEIKEAIPGLNFGTNGYDVRITQPKMFSWEAYLAQSNID